MFYKSIYGKFAYFTSILSRVQLRPYFTLTIHHTKYFPTQQNFLLLLRPATKLGQGYVFTGVCDSVNRRGCLPQCMLGYTPSWSRHPPGADTPEHTPPRSRHPLEQTPPGADTPWSRPPRPDTPRSKHPLGADTPLLEQTAPPGADTPGSRHPSPGADTPPPRSRHPRQSMLGYMVNARAVRILLGCNLVYIYCHLQKSSHKFRCKVKFHMHSISKGLSLFITKNISIKFITPRRLKLLMMNISQIDLETLICVKVHSPQLLEFFTISPQYKNADFANFRFSSAIRNETD